MDRDRSNAYGRVGVPTGAYGQVFVIVLPVPTGEHDGEHYESWTAEAVEQTYLTAAETEPVGIAEVMPDKISNGWASALMDACDAAQLLGRSE